jgi:putative Mg2+ transporter-C (MgtC) family protein
MVSTAEIDIVTKLVVAVFLGSVIGLEREYNRSAAGMKTYSIVCLGSCLFTLAALLVNVSIAAGVITGIGFLGAAVVFKNENKVVGITTAALIWTVSAIGFVVGLGYYFAAVVTAILLLVILIPMEMMERKLFKTHIIQEK